jgi:hypothetical protein
MSSKLRPELVAAEQWEQTVSREEALKKLYTSVAKRRSLARGKLTDGEQHCALGCLAEDLKKMNGDIIITPELADEIAMINDKLPPECTSKQRWQYVMKWLRQELATFKKSK